MIGYKQVLAPLDGFIPERTSIHAARSIDGGRSFNFERKINRPDFTPAVNNDARLNPSCLDDYLDIKAGVTANGPSRKFVMAWGDSRRVMPGHSGIIIYQNLYAFAKNEEISG